MLKIAKDKIYLTRGDTAFIEISITDEHGDPYEYKEGDHVYFRLKQSSTAKVIIIEKEINLETGQLLIEPDDTKDLKFMVYRYEVELVTVEGYHFTVIEDSPFEIGPELEVHADGQP